MYKYSDILFCLREEYVKNAALLRELEQCINIPKSNRDVKFHLEKEDKDPVVELYYEVLKEQGLIKDLLTKVIGIDTSYETGKMARTINGMYQPDSKSFYVEREPNSFFGAVVNEVLENPFTNVPFNIEVENNEENLNIDRKIIIAPDRLFVDRRNNTDHLCSIYDSVNDVVRFSNNKGKSTYDAMYDMLAMEFPKEKFPEDIRAMIESKEQFGLTTYIYDNDDNKKEKDFEPVVEERRLVLVRK